MATFHQQWAFMRNLLDFDFDSAHIGIRHLNDPFSSPVLVYIAQRAASSNSSMACKLVDGTSSHEWACVHGYAHPRY